MTIFPLRDRLRPEKRERRRRCGICRQAHPTFADRQKQLAEKLFVTRQTVSAWETGRARPGLETLERIAALEADVTEVICGAPQPQTLGPLKCR